MDTETLKEFIDTVIGVLSTWGIQVVGALALLVVGRWIAGALRSATRRNLERSKLDASLIPFVSSLTYYLVLAVVVIAVLNLFGIQTASLIAILGAVGLAVGLAMQGTLSNFSAGVMLLVFRPISVGDFVEVSASSGTVVEIGLFATLLNSSDNIRVIVPNSRIYNQTIRNFSVNAQRRIDLTVGIGYDDDIDRAIEVVRATLDADSRVLSEPAMTVTTGELADSSVNLIVRPWCRREDYFLLRGDLLRQLKHDLEANGCTLPYPQQDVHLHPPSA